MHYTDFQSVCIIRIPIFNQHNKIQLDKGTQGSNGGRDWRQHTNGVMNDGDLTTHEQTKNEEEGSIITTGRV